MCPSSTAPKDSAFNKLDSCVLEAVEKLPAEQLHEVLTTHAVGTVVTSSTFGLIPTLISLSGATLSLDKNSEHEMIIALILADFGGDGSVVSQIAAFYGKIVAFLIGRKLSTVNNEESFQRDDPSITVSEAMVVEPYDTYVTNGLFHAIDEVLLLSALPSPPKPCKAKSGKAKSSKSKPSKTKSSKERGNGGKMGMEHDGAMQQKPSRKRHRRHRRSSGIFD